MNLLKKQNEMDTSYCYVPWSGLIIMFKATYLWSTIEN